MTRDNPVYNQRQNPDMFKEKIIVTAVTLKMRKGFFFDRNNGHQDFYCSNQCLNTQLHEQRVCQVHRAPMEKHLV